MVNNEAYGHKNLLLENGTQLLTTAYFCHQDMMKNA
jgi:hypothetical protein